MTVHTQSFARRAAVVASAAVYLACGDSTAPIDAADDAARAAQTFAQLADSVARNGGEADVGAAYAGIAGIVRAGGHITPIVLSVDGVATTFIAAASTFETTINDCPKGAQCFAPPSTFALRNLIAWDKDHPKRLVQLSSSNNDEVIGAILDPSPLALYARMASLVYMDGVGGTYIGTSGSQKFDVTKSATPCPEPTDSGKVGYLRPNGTCTLADHTVSFSGALIPSPFQLTSTAAKGTHTIAMSAQTVAGTLRAVTVNNLPCDTACTKPIDSLPLLPPVKVRPANELPAKLSATVNGDVTLTFTVKNTSDAPVKVVYPSGQKYDFVVADSGTGKVVWTWSANRSFVQALGEETIPAGGTLTFTEKWTPPKRGLYLAHALLTSTSHRSEAYAAVVVP
ncbi:MAG: BsuPI-related putative proteinase inhibitor [Gemmatimonadaceae bacterium]